MIKNHYSTDIQSFKNALNLQGTSQEKEAMLYFNDKTVSFSAVREFLDRYRVENL